MKVTVEDAGPCRKLLSVHAPPDAIRSEYERIVEVYRTQGKVPGFRPGRAPAAVAERHYARQITEDAKERLIPELYRKAIEEQGISVVAVVGVRDVTLDKAHGCAFRATLDVAPQFKLPKYRKLSLRGRKVEVTGEEQDAALQRLRESRARFEDVTGRPVRSGDLVSIDYAGLCDGRPVGELAPDCTGLGEGQEFWVLTGEEQQQFLPGFSDALTGLETGGEKDITVSFPADYHVAAVAGREALYHVTVRAVRERVLPELDAAFLKELGMDSEEALRERIRGDLAAAAEQEERGRLKDEIARQLVEKTSFDLPQTVVAQETDLTVRGIVRRITMEGGSRQQIEERSREIVQSAAETSQERVKVSYILSRIADEEGIAVEDSEVDERIALLAGRYGMPVERFRAELERRNGVEGLKSELRSERTLEALLETAKVKV